MTTPSENNNLLTVKARGRIGTTFLKLAGNRWSTLPIAASATARRTTLGMELALVLDVTGSLDTGDAIGKLRTASRSLIDILFGDKTSIDTLYVSIVPFTASVNFGTSRTAWLSNYTPGNFSPHSWRGCTEARTAPEDESDTPPVTTPTSAAAVKFKPFYYASTNGTRSPSLTDNDWKASGNPPPNDTSTTTAATAYTPANERTGPNLGCGQPMTGLDNNRDRLRAVIAALRTSHRNGTIIPVGLQAGWMTLSPKWRGLWKTNPWGSTTPDGLPLAYNTPFMQKVILLITDGENNWYQFEGSPQPDYTSYGRLAEKRLGNSITTSAAAKTELDARTLRMCNKIKSNNIIIYTITVSTGAAISQSTKNLFQSCATSANYYYDAPNASQLNTIFTQIGSQLSNLRLER